ncbi:MAG: hypothetical protein KDA89_06765, partial [Planctomycetaceae bacterium]|nr:hypothetical protein [Planctomycetaceae bacterium]
MRLLLSGFSPATDPSVGIMTPILQAAYAPPVHAALVADSGGSASSAPATAAVTASKSATIKTQPPTTIAAGTPFSIAFTIIDNVTRKAATTYNGNVTIALGNNPSGAALSGVLTVAARNGVATFSGLSLNKIGTGYTIQASAADVSIGTTRAFSVTAGTTTKLVLTTPPPGNVSAGKGLGLTAKAYDKFGNLATGFRGTVTAAVAAKPAGAQAASGTLRVTAVGGVATFSNLVLKTAGNYTISLTTTGAPKITTDIVRVSPGVATGLTIVTQPPRTTAVGSGFGVSVKVFDAFGNAATGFTGNITATISKNAGGGSLGGTVTVPAANGVATFTGLTLNKVGTGYTLQISGTGLKSIITGAVSVTPGAVSRLAITTQPPGTVNAGAKFKVAVTAQDAFGNKATTFAGNVSIAPADISGATALGGTLVRKATGGVVTFDSLTLSKAGTGYKLVASVGAVAATTNAFSIAALAAKTLAVRTLPAKVAAGTGFDVVATANDIYGNVATGFSGQAVLNLSSNPTGASLNGTTSVAFSGGVATFRNLTINKAGAYAFRITGGSLPAIVTSSMTVTAALELSTGIVAPLSTTSVTLRGAGFSTTAATTVTLTDSAGQEYPATVLSVEATRVTFAVPFLMDFTTGNSVAGTVAVNVRQQTAAGTVNYDAAQQLAINDLPQTSSAPGTLTTEVLVQMQALLANSIADYQKITQLSRNSLDSATFIAALGDEKTTTAELQAALAPLTNNTTSSLGVGTSNGVPITLNAASLRLMDRVYAAVFANLNSPSQTLSSLPVGNAGAFGFTRSAAVLSSSENFDLKDIKDFFGKAITKDFIGEANSSVEKLRNVMTAAVGIVTVAARFLPLPAEAVVAGGVLGAFSFMTPTLLQLVNSVAVQGGGNTFLNGKATIEDFRETLRFAKSAAWSAMQSAAFDFVGTHASDNQILGAAIGRAADSAVSTYETFFDNGSSTNSFSDRLDALFTTLQNNAVNPPSIGLNSTSFVFFAPLGGASPTSQSFTLSNTGSAFSNLITSYSVSGNSPSAVQLSGLYSLSGGQSATVTISVSTSGLAKGTYINTVSLYDPAAGNSPRTITVTIYVVGAVIGLSPASLSMTVIQGQSEQTRTITISNIGTTGSVLTYITSANNNRVSVSGNARSLPVGASDTLTVTSRASSLSVGTYTDNLFVIDSHDSSNYKYITVTITVQAPPLPVIGGTSDVYFTATEGGPSPAAQSVSISNIGAAGSYLTWAAIPSSNLISLSGGVLTVGANFFTTATLSVNTAGVAAGTYTGRVTVYSPTDSRVVSKVITVHITITAPVFPAWGALESGANGQSSDRRYSISSAPMAITFYAQPFSAKDRFVVSDESGLIVYRDTGFIDTVD